MNNSIRTIRNNMPKKEEIQDNSQNSIDLMRFKSSVFEWAEKIDVNIKEVHVRPMKNKWGSISTNGRMSLNTELLEMDTKFRDYVVVHELIHLKVPNHGKLFKSLLHAFIPRWEEISKLGEIRK